MTKRKKITIPSKTTTPPKQREQQRKVPLPQKTTYQIIRMEPLMMIGLISSLLGIFGFFFLVYPRMSLSPGVSLDSRNPFKTPFIIKNDGYLPLYNIKYSLIAERMETIGGSTFTNSGGSVNNPTVEQLDPNKSTTLFVDRIFSMPPNYVKSAMVFIRVTYRPFLVPFSFTESMRFRTEIKVNGEYVWFEYYNK